MGSSIFTFAKKNDKNLMSVHENTRSIHTQQGFHGLITASGVDALKYWTGKANVKIVFDSTVDEFKDFGLFFKVQCRPNIAIIGFTTDGDVFGGFYSVAVKIQAFDYIDPNIFVFSFASHGRCKTPQKFDVCEGLMETAYVYFSLGDSGRVLFSAGGNAGGGFWLGHEKSDSYCHDLSRGFKGLEDTTLSGNDGTWQHGPYFHCARLIAVQLS